MSYPQITINNRFGGAVIVATTEYPDLTAWARSGALCDEDLRGANLYGANLSGANLSGANLSGANLYGANLSGIVPNWTQHTLLAEILRQAAVAELDHEDHLPRLMLAGLPLVTPGWCWKEYLKLPIQPSVRRWALNVLRQCSNPPTELAS